MFPVLSLSGIEINSLFGPVVSSAQYTFGDTGPKAGIAAFGSTFAVNVINTGDLHFASAAAIFPAFAASAAVLAAVAFVFASVAFVLASEATDAVVAPSANVFAAVAAVFASPASVFAVVAAATDGPPKRIASSATVIALSAIVTASFARATWSELNYDSAMSASIVAGQVYEIVVPTASLTAFDPDAVRGFVPTYSVGALTLNDASLLPNFTSYNYTAGNISFYVTASATVSAGNLSGSLTVFYNKATQMSPYNVGDFEAGNAFAVPNAESSTEIVIPEINIQLQSQAIVAKTKKLKAVWTPEFAQDLNAYQALDAEAEVTNIMSEYISLEIDLEILDMLIEDAAAGTEYWTVLNNGVYNPNNTNGFDFPTSNTQTGFYNTQGQWFQTLGTKMQKLSNKIHQLTLRGGANFLVCSPTVATVIESIPGFASNSDGSADKMEYAFGVQKAGQLNSRYTVYKNPYMTENTILMGFRGTQFLEAGAVFAPYIPLIMTPLIYDPDTFTPRKGLLTRYAKKMLRPEFYGKIYVSGLNSL